MVAGMWSVVLLKPVLAELELVPELCGHVSEADDQSNKITLVNVVGLIIIIVLNQ
jgi:hypothetical protein